MNTVTTQILTKYPGAGRDKLIPILQEVQEADGYISKEAVALIGRHLGLAASKIYGVATFYNQFRFKPKGAYHIMVCRGTACHVKGSADILSALERLLQLKAGDTSRDGRFSIEVVACIGACGLAPVICVNGEYHGKLTVDKLEKIIESYRQREAAHGN